MILFTVPLIIGWIIVIFAQNLAMVYVGRFLNGKLHHSSFIGFES